MPVRRVLAALISVVSLLLLTAACVIPKPTPAAAAPRITMPRGNSCPSHIVYGVRGSGEAFDDGTLGLGVPIKAFYAEMSRDFGASNVGAEANGYQAVAVAFSLGGHAIPALTIIHYGSSVRGGVTAFDHDIPALVARCPHSRIDVVGYSQGADVVRRGLAALPATAEVRLHITSTTLFGDPNFSGSESNVGRLGTYTTSRSGIARNFTGISGLGPVPGFIGGPYGVVSYCNALDGVCQYPQLNFSDHYLYDKTFATSAAWSAAVEDSSHLKEPILSGGPVDDMSCPIPQNSVTFNMDLQLPPGYSPKYSTVVTVTEDGRRIFTSTLSQAHQFSFGTVALTGSGQHLIAVSGMGQTLGERYYHKGQCI